MATYQINVNGERREVNVHPSTPLLWVLREDLKMTGTKFGCGISACGACTVHLGGVATRSCIVPISHVGDRGIVTIEGIGQDSVGRAVQDAWVEEDVVQCGYCQSGQIMAGWRYSNTRLNQRSRTSKSRWAEISVAVARILAFARQSRTRRRS